MTEHKAILAIKDLLQIYEAADNDDLENMFYNQLTLEDILDNLKLYNSLIGELKQILRKVQDDNN